MENMEHIKVGDKVIAYFDSLHESNLRRIETVERLTKTLIITNHGRYTRSHGDEPGGGYHAGRIEVATPELISEVKIEIANRAMIYRLSKVDWKTLDHKRLTQVTTIVLEAAKEKG